MTHPFPEYKGDFQNAPKLIDARQSRNYAVWNVVIALALIVGIGCAFAALIGAL